MLYAHSRYFHLPRNPRAPFGWRGSSITIRRGAGENIVTAGVRAPPVDEPSAPSSSHFAPHFDFVIKAGVRATHSSQPMTEGRHNGLQLHPLRCAPPPSPLTDALAQLLSQYPVVSLSTFPPSFAAFIPIRGNLHDRFSWFVPP